MIRNKERKVLRFNLVIKIFVGFIIGFIIGASISSLVLSANMINANKTT